MFARGILRLPPNSPGAHCAPLLWPYCLMQAGMNANRSEDVLAGQAVQFAAASALWLAAMFVIAYLLLKERDVKA